MGKAFLGREDDMGSKQLLVLVLPPVFGLITVVLFATGLWWAGSFIAVLGVVGTVWAHRARSNEEADEAIAAAGLWEREHGVAGEDSSDGDTRPRS
jgi:hypothetical protein